MNKMKKIEYSQQLHDKKKKLEKELKNLEEDILENQNDCEHVSIIMKSTTDSFPTYGRIFRCLSCGQYLSYATEFFIDARDYLTETQEDEKFDMLQTMALWLLRNNPEMTLEEFTIIFNNMIQESISLKEKNSNDEMTYKRDLTKGKNILQ